MYVILLLIMDIKRIRKLGGSYIVVIPPKYIKALNFVVGDYVREELIEDTLQINKIDFSREIKEKLNSKEALHAG